MHGHIVAYINLDLMSARCKEDSIAVLVELTVGDWVPPRLCLINRVDDLLSIALVRMQDLHVFGVPGGRVRLRAHKD